MRPTSRDRPAVAPASAAAAVDVPEDCAVPPFIDLSQYNVVIGTDAAETLFGTNGPDFICGRLGNDRIFAFGGNDLLLGDNTTFFGNVNAPGGDDIVLAGAGDDEVLPGPGDDTVNGGPGDDFLALAVGDDIGVGGHGSDTIIGGFGRDLVLGGQDDDFLAGGFDDDVLVGGPATTSSPVRLPPDSAPPPIEPAGRHRRLVHRRLRNDTAQDCDHVVGVETVL